MTFRSLLLCAVLPFALLAACGDDDGKDGDDDAEPKGPATGSTGKEEACAELCEASQACAELDVEECTSDCAEGDNTSRVGQEALTACFDESACALDEVAGLEVIACVLEELDETELSEEAKTFCDSSVDAINACSEVEPTEFLPGGCESSIALASDELLEGLNGCAEESCEDQQACLELELFKAVPLDVLTGLESGELSPAAAGELLPLLLVFGQLSLQGGAAINPDDFGFGAGGAN